MTEIVLWKAVEAGAAWSEVVGWGLAEAAGEGAEVEVSSGAGDPDEVLEPALPQAAAATGRTNNRHTRSLQHLGEFIRSIMCLQSNCRFARRQL
jgi:hypothetical protein